MKALCDVVVTSANVFKIIKNIPSEEIIFVPDSLMAKNMQIELEQAGVKKNIISATAVCMVHDRFNSSMIEETRARYSNLAVVSHPECTPEVTRASHYVGSTTTMMDYVIKTDFDYYLMLTECGLVSRLQVEHPTKRFVGSCQLCPHMKKNSLQNILQVMQNPTDKQIVKVKEEVRVKALRALDQMFAM